MATMTLFIIVKIYWENINVLSYTPDIQFNIPNTNPGWLPEVTAYVIVKIRGNGHITISHEEPMNDRHRGAEHLDESGRVRGFRNNYIDYMEYDGEQEIFADP